MLTHMMSLPAVAIVGRPNVGKSTLFNRIVQQRLAITDDQPGVTRDRIYRPAQWQNRQFQLIDTGGYAAWDDALLPQLISDEVRKAIAEAAVIVMLADVTAGVTAADEEIAALLRPLAKPVLLAVNKVDHPGRQFDLAEFYRLGLGAPLGVSSLHGSGVGDLLDAVVEALGAPPEHDEAPSPDSAPIRVAILGRPNVGKSTLLNTLLNEPRSLVSPFPGTTRDPVDAALEVDGRSFVLVDTAGIRRRGKPAGVEKYSVARARAAVRQSDVCLLMIDAVEGLTATDAKVFSIADQYARAAVLVVNKWDLVERGEHAAREFERNVRDTLPFLSYAPLITVSAKTGLRARRIFSLVEQCYASFTQRVPTAELNQLLRRILAVKQPARVSGKAPNILYISQVGIAPPTFVLFVSNPDALHFSYKRFLINQLREAFGFAGTPLVLLARQRSGGKGVRCERGGSDEGDDEL